MLGAIGGLWIDLNPGPASIDFQIGDHEDDVLQALLGQCLVGCLEDRRSFGTAFRRGVGMGRRGSIDGDASAEEQEG
jgi:hypothetical protein